MKKIFTSFIAVLLTAICAVAQLPYNTVMTQSHFNDGNTTIEKQGTTSWSDGVRLGNRSGGGFNYDDKYVIIALSSNGVPGRITCSTGVSGILTVTDITFYIATSPDNVTYTTQKTSTDKNNSFDVELPKNTKYVKLCYSGNFAGDFKNIKVSELIEVKDPAKMTLDADTAEINTENTTIFTTMEWCNTSAFTPSISGEGASQFTASISNNASKGKYGTATIYVTYEHNNVGTHNAKLTISNGAFTKEITLTGTTTKKTPYLLWRTDLEEKLPLNEVVTDPAYSPNGQNLPIIYSSSDEEVLMINGNSFITVAEGTATITASTEETDEYYAATSITKTFTVTVKKIQSIVWSDNLTRLKIGDQPDTLTAIVQLVDSTGNKYDAPERTALLTYTSADTTVVSVSGNVLTIVGEGETTLTAEVPGDDEQEIEPASVTIPVKVRQPSVGCEDVLLLNNNSEHELFSSSLSKPELTTSTFAINTSLGVPGQLTFQHSGKEYWTTNYKGTIKAQQSTNGGSSWTDIAGSEVTPTKGTYKTHTVSLDRKATHIRFVRPQGGEGYHYIKGILVTPAQYIETDIKSISENSIVGATILKDININYSNVKGEVTIAKSHPNVLISNEYFDVECGDFGTKTLQVGIIPTEIGTINDEIVIEDAVSGMKTIVPITINVKRDNQTIAWEQDLANIHTTDNITLNAKAKTEVYYTSSDSTIAYADGNQLIINKYGHVTIKAVAPQDEKYEQATASKDITINAVQPTVSAWPTVEPIAYKQALTTDLLMGGEAEVEGYFDWNTELNQTLVPNTYNLAVRFIPTNTNYYTSVDGTVSVTINKSAQSIIWNDSFENITVTDSIRLTASAQTQVTYEVSDTELAYITENVLYFTRGGVVLITAYASEDDYYLATETVRELTILPAKPSILVKPTAKAITYGQTIGESLLEGGEASVLGTFNWLDSLAIPNAGIYWQYVRFTPDDQESFEPVDFQVEVHVNKATQTITWELTNFVMKVGDVLNLTAVATSGLEVTYTLDDDTYAEINNNVLTALQVGTVTVTASQDGTSVDEFGGEHTNYFAAESVSQTITIVAKDVNTGTDLTFPEVKATKIIRDGRLYIIRNNRTYNVNGQVLE